MIEEISVINSFNRLHSLIWVYIFTVYTGEVASSKNLRSVSTKCRLQTADRVQNADYVQNADCRLQTGYKMQTDI